MNVQDLHTIVQYEIPVIISVINNNGYLAIRHTQASFQEKRYYGTHPDWGLTMPNIEKIAKGFGINYLKIKKPEEVDSTIEQLKSTKVPIVCEIITSETQEVLFKQKYIELENGNFQPQSLSKMAP